MPVTDTHTHGKSLHSPESPRPAPTLPQHSPLQRELTSSDLPLQRAPRPASAPSPCAHGTPGTQLTARSLSHDAGMEAGGIPLVCRQAAVLVEQGLTGAGTGPVVTGAGGHPSSRPGAMLGSSAPVCPPSFLAAVRVTPRGLGAELPLQLFELPRLCSYAWYSSLNFLRGWDDRQAAVHPAYVFVFVFFYLKTSWGFLVFWALHMFS